MKKDFLDKSTEKQIETLNNIRGKLKMLEIPVKKWYQKQYPTDELGNKLNSEITFADIYIALFIHMKDVYDVLGIRDSVIRERVLEKLAELLKLPYENFIMSY